MMGDKSFLGIIPARGGSKRLPKKNIKILGDKPLIAYSIEASHKSEYLDEVMVTTDCDEIIEVSKAYGANVPFKRPLSLAKDSTSSVDTVLHAIEYYEDEMGKNFDYVVLLQPTSPLRNQKHIDEAIELLKIKNADAIISVCEMEHSPLWSNTLPKDGNMTNFLTNDIKNKRSQDLDKYFRINGAIYICNIKKLLEAKTFYLEKNIYAYKMDISESVDIDNIFDFQVAELLLNKKIKEIEK